MRTFKHPNFLKGQICLYNLIMQAKAQIRKQNKL